MYDVAVSDLVEYPLSTAYKMGCILKNMSPMCPAPVYMSAEVLCAHVFEISTISAVM